MGCAAHKLSRRKLPFPSAAEDSGRSAEAPVTYAAYPGERVVISGGVPLDGLVWERVAGSSPQIYRAKLPARAPATFTGLFGVSGRLTRARYPNCADIHSASCFTLNASGPTAASVQSPTRDIMGVADAVNLEVVNARGIDMFGDASSDDARASGPHGASDATLAPGTNLTLVVDHPDYAWRCHEDCGWEAYSKWRGVECTTAACRMDASHNEPCDVRRTRTPGAESVQPPRLVLTRGLRRCGPAAVWTSG